MVQVDLHDSVFEQVRFVQRLGQKTENDRVFFEFWFADKIQNVDMNVCFSDYTGGKRFEKRKEKETQSFIFCLQLQEWMCLFEAQVQEAESSTEQAGEEEKEEEKVFV
jgi:hypothetical protein